MNYLLHKCLAIQLGHWYQLMSSAFDSLFLYSQENVKTKHPQLLYESKIYRILQGGSMEAFDCSYVLWDVRIRFRAGGTDNLCSDSWDTKRQMVWCIRRLQCLGYGFTWTKP